LKSRPLSKPAWVLLKEVAGASNGKLKYLRWAMYGTNQLQHPIHNLPAQEREQIWNTLKVKPA
jgi:hypothetical protein